ncbi:PREDICTED: BAG family molecular chaperone regulator 3-like [Ipomoea nil]|uniref:BAG family molecular chaperone regulator 3-like n=1 Tax=Ipomoea nil TaxID=35883 RepID=UPI0009016838|nr:PREDICTED: BAG family molecular chaperone regulator 3-like [Ipomoea nil]
MMNNKGLVRMKRNTVAGNGTMLSPAKNGDGAAAGWEVRPCGMLVQKRSSDFNQSVKYGSSHHEVYINSQANLGDQMNREKRCPEMCRTVKMENSSKEITAIRLEIDKLAKQVGNVEMDIYGGKKVAEMAILNMIELFMTQLIKLDGISGDGNVKLQRRMEVKRVQKYIENLDMLKIRNSTLGSNNARVAAHQFQQVHNKLAGRNNEGPIRVTAKWANF